MGESFIYHLKGKRFSGRGIKLRELDAAEVNTARLVAAKEAGKDASGFEVETRRRAECMHRMIEEVTEKGDLATLDGAKWIKVTQEQLEEEGGKLSFNALFGAKDANAIAYLCRQLIEVGDDEIAAIDVLGVCRWMRGEQQLDSDAGVIAAAIAIRKALMTRAHRQGLA